jgi:multiple sugar transport system permease protein
MSSAQTQAADQTPSAKRRRGGMSDSTLVKLFIWPTLALLLAMNVFPLFYSLILSFTKYSAISNQPPVFVGVQNYVNLLADPQLWTYFVITGRYVFLSVGIELVLGFGLALLLREPFRGSSFITTLILVSMMMSPVVVGLFFKLVYNPGYGIFNLLLGYGVGGGPDWIGSSQHALWSVVITDVWIWTPFVMLISMAGLSAIPSYLYEAARMDRASSWFQFWRITLPQVAPMLMIALLFRTIEAFKSFDIVMGLTAGGPGDSTELVAVSLYRLAFLGNWNTGKACALAYIVLVIIIGVSNIYIKYLDKIKEG